MEFAPIVQSKFQSRYVYLESLYEFYSLIDFGLDMKEHSSDNLGHLIFSLRVEQSSMLVNDTNDN